jgi:hypothetical protein
VQSILKVYTDEFTSKAFAYKDKTSVAEIHALMAEKLELSPEATKDYALFEKTEEGVQSVYARVTLVGQVKLEDPEEKIVKIMKKWKGKDGRIVWVRISGVFGADKTPKRPQSQYGKFK